ncbi:MAG TPA: PEPxxWA-CTERM sorting domain-containing protein [Sphingomonas sp.]|uniref:PEPxxWA-CTERM sorting domain-containing protein n=1 Tax=Sphingomonas sp. TaxID=28214 RepID=UPI002CBB4B88|nr:PEPxxWA-CTERM sorting domain-containing protein [Sphingomonas sp.]HMI19466.1 PEPxxWA-CTERM sorting domain-containing protein [Sphingomonas sp.]
MMYRGLSLACIAVACASAAPALSQTVDFNDLGVGYTYLAGSPLTDNGFTFDATPGHRFLVWSAADNAWTSPDPTGAALGTQDQDSIITVAKVGGGAFTLNSIDLTDIYNGGFSVYGDYGGTVQFTFNYALGGSSTQTFVIDGAAGWQTDTLNITGLSSFSVQGLRTFLNLFQIDNMVTSQTNDDVNSPAPEPASWAMMLMGFGAMGAALRRRRASVTFA